jgi:hypothetical protein
MNHFTINVIEEINWTHLVEDRVRFREASASMVMSIRVQ